MKDEFDAKHIILNVYDTCVSAMKIRLFIYNIIFVSLLFIKIMYSSNNMSWLLIMFFTILIVTVLIDAFYFMKNIKFYKSYLNKITADNYNAIMKEFNQAWAAKKAK